MTDQQQAVDPAAVLTGPGAPFEMSGLEINGMQCRIFRDAPAYLSAYYGGLAGHGDKTLVVCGDQRLSYQEVTAQAARLAGWLRDTHDVKRGTRVALAVSNRPEWLVAFLAITSLGGVAALINARGAADEVRYCVESTGCSLLIADQRCASALADKVTLTLPQVIVDDDGAQGKEESLARILDAGRLNELPETPCDTDDPALILFTSGTTGRPKGVLLSHRGVITSLKTNQYSSALIGMQIAARFGIDLQTLAANRPRPCTLLVFPLFHVSGCHTGMLSNLIQGGKIVLMPKWDPEVALDLIDAEQVTSFPTVPAMMWDVLKLPGLKDRNFPSLSSVSVAGQATPLPLLQAIGAAFPNALLGTGYGMTETNGVIALTVGEDFLHRPTCAGKPVDTNEVRIRGESGQWLGPGQAGEVCIRGATVMLGYANQAEANDKALDNGWLRTGDVAYLDDDGFIFIVDRLTDMVISGGENIYCAEVERVLIEHEAVITAAAVGIPHDRLGEQVVAAVQIRPDAKVTDEDLNAFARDSLAAYKAPKRYLITDQALPTTNTGKVVKKHVRDMFQSS